MHTLGTPNCYLPSHLCPTYNDGLFPRGTSITERREKEKEAFVQILYISENGAAANESFQYSFYQEVIAYPGGALKSENIIR